MYLKSGIQNNIPVWTNIRKAVTFGQNGLYIRHYEVDEIPLQHDQVVTFDKVLFAKFITGISRPCLNSNMSQLK